MALTITTQPTDTASASSSIVLARNLYTCLRALRFVVTSDDSDIVNIVADVYRNGSYWFTRALPTTGSRTSVFDFSRAIEQGIMRNLLDNINFRIPTYNGTAAVAANTDWCPSIQVKFYEELDSGSGLTTTWAADGAGTGSVDSDSINVFPKPFPRNDHDVVDGYIGETNGIGDPTNGVSFFLSQTSNNAEPKKLPTTARSYLTGFFVDANSRVRCEQYDSSGSLLRTDTLYTVSSAGLVVFGVGPVEIAAHATLDASTTDYRIYCEYDTGGGGPYVRNSEYDYYRIDDGCYEYAAMVHHLGLNGGIDSFYLRGDYSQVRTQDGEQSFRPASDGSTYDPRLHDELALRRPQYDLYEVTIPVLSQEEMRFFTNMESSIVQLIDVDPGSRRNGAFFLPSDRRPYKGGDQIFQDVTARFKYFDLRYHAF